MPGAEGEGKWEVTASRYRVSFWGDKNVLKFIVATVAHTLNIPKAIKLNTLNGQTRQNLNYIPIKLLYEKKKKKKKEKKWLKNLGSGS